MTRPRWIVEDDPDVDMRPKLSEIPEVTASRLSREDKLRLVGAALDGKTILKRRLEPTGGWSRLGFKTTPLVFSPLIQYVILEECQDDRHQTK